MGRCGAERGGERARDAGASGGGPRRRQRPTGAADRARVGSLLLAARGEIEGIERREANE